MDESIKPILQEMEDHMQKSIAHLKAALQKIRAGKAAPEMIESVTVEYYGSPVPVNQVATVSAADARTLTISPWEKKMISVIERAILEANLGFTPSNDGEMIRIVLPSLTEERRKQLVKQTKTEGEQAKVAIRNVRKDSNDKLRTLQKNGLAEDMIKNAEKKVQDITNLYITRVDEVLKEKEDQIMTI